MTYRKKPKPRHKLPNRRLVENRKLKTQTDQTIHLSIGYDPEEPDRPREVFYSQGFKSGSQLEFHVQDTCVLISLLLQHGHMPKDIAKSLARQTQPGGGNSYASVIGLIVDELVTG